MMSKIGVLTFHNNENRGAILQAYCLCNVLEETLDENVEIIEYRTESKERSRMSNLVISRRPLRLPVRYRDRRIVERFFDTNLPTSTRSITSDNHSSAVSWLKKQGYNILVTGSDEIWKVTNKPQNSLGDLISPSRPFPNLYFLDPSLPGTKVAYAASGNRTDLDGLSTEERNTLERHLHAYDAISVRDRHTEQLVQELGIDDVFRVPDPTLMTEIPDRDSASILEEHDIDTNQSILGFHAPDSPLFQEICELYRDRGYQIVATRSSRFADVELEGVVDPFEYYSLYDHFDMVVTNSLHSTIFSIKHGTPFATIDVSDRYRTLESKTHSLLDDFSLLDRHIDAVDGGASKFYENRSRLEEKPDEDHITDRIAKLQEQGYEFLDKVKEIHEANH